MVKFIDNFLNGHTQYRLMLYFLILLVAAAVVLSFFGVLPFQPINIIFSTVFLVIVCWASNTLFAKFSKAFTNLESVYITALILALIVTPIRTPGDLLFLSGVAVVAMASKYIIAVNRKHIFNPAAFAVVLSALTLNYGASWWIGNRWMLFFVILGGFLIVRKLQRFNMVFSFLIVYSVIISVAAVLKGNDILTLVQNAFLDSPLLFFAVVMLTEPQTTPPDKKFQMIYGGLTGIGFNFATPEIALLINNLFSYIVSFKGKLLLNLKEKLQIAPDIYDFVFGIDRKLRFLPGQYMEWTLDHKNPDSRGTRRYFTIAASPTEGNLRIGVKFYPNGSSFKKALLSLKPGEEAIVGQLAGEFILPKSQNSKLCFIAGGIGITPYRSMIKYLLDINQKRDIILISSNKTPADVVYKNIFDEADRKLGIKTIYVFGQLGPEVITKEVADYKERIFYLSGPHSLVDAFELTLKKMGVPGNRIKIDFFPGYA